MITEKHIKMASRLYEARDTARQILGEKYAARIEENQQAIRDVMVLNKCQALPAAMALYTEIHKQNPHGSGAALVVVLAAYVEMQEPSETMTTKL